jgi:uncharacterized glyoxalase superfamily protein PhnB
MMVEDVNATIDFYRDVLGFDVVMSVPDRGRREWVLMRRGHVEVMFQARGSLLEAVPCAADVPAGTVVTYYLGTRDVDLLYERVRPRAHVVEGLHTTSYGTREFAITDCNGFILNFAEEIEVEP